MQGSRTGLGCCAKPPPTATANEPSKGLRIRGKTVKKPSISEGFWSTSPGEVDNSAVKSQSSGSSMCTSNLSQDLHNSAGGMRNPTQFVNQGLLLWNQSRQQWTGNKRPENRAQVKDSKLSLNATYENLLGTNKPFPQPIPLLEMVDFLVNEWEQEGLYG